MIDRISEIHAATTAMFISNNKNLCDFFDPSVLSNLSTKEQDVKAAENNEVTMALKDDTDLVFRTLAHFLRRVPGYLEKHHLICKYKSILVTHFTQPVQR